MENHARLIKARQSWVSRRSLLCHFFFSLVLLFSRLPDPVSEILELQRPGLADGGRVVAVAVAQVQVVSAVGDHDGDQRV